MHLNMQSTRPGRIAGQMCSSQISFNTNLLFTERTTSDEVANTRPLFIAKPLVRLSTQAQLKKAIGGQSRPSFQTQCAIQVLQPRCVNSPQRRNEAECYQCFAACNLDVAAEASGATSQLTYKLIDTSPSRQVHPDSRRTGYGDLASARAQCRRTLAKGTRRARLVGKMVTVGAMHTGRGPHLERDPRW